MSPDTTTVVNLERRVVQWPTDADYLHEIRADATKIIGHAIVCDVRSRDLGGFLEVVAPAAIERALTADVVCLFNHNTSAPLGRTPKTLHLSRDTRGLAFQLDPAPTQAGRDALELVRRGDVRGASFGFTTLKDHWTRDGATTIRTLLDIELHEISLTAAPIYQQTDVTIALRSMSTFDRTAMPPTGRRVAWLRQALRAGNR